MAPAIDANVVPRSTQYKPTKGPPPSPFLEASLFEPTECPQRQGQPQNIPDTAIKPHQLFELFFDDVIIDTIVLATNQNAERKRIEQPTLASSIQKWDPVTCYTIQHFIGKLIY